MATQPPPANLPLFYNNLQPLSSSLHGNCKARATDSAPYLAHSHAIPADHRRVHRRAAPLSDRLLDPATIRCRWR